MPSINEDPASERSPALPVTGTCCTEEDGRSDKRLIEEAGHIFSAAQGAGSGEELFRPASRSMIPPDLHVVCEDAALIVEARLRSSRAMQPPGCCAADTVWM